MLTLIVGQTEIRANPLGCIQGRYAQHLLIQADHVAMFLTSEAVKASVIRIQAHGRRIFGMEKAAGKTPAA